MKNLLNSGGTGSFSVRREKIACNTCTFKSPKKLIDKYANPSHQQRSHAPKQHRFYLNLHNKAMEVVRADMRNGKHGGWREFFQIPFIESLGQYK